MSDRFTPSKVYDTYWRFAAERQAMYERRLANPVGPWTEDQILRRYRFTNTYRASDRVSQYLIREIQYGPQRATDPAEIFFRTLLFKIFNKIETWELIESALGSISWQSIDLDQLDQVLQKAMHRGTRIYSAAYIMPAPNLGKARKHSNHLALLQRMMQDAIPGRIMQAASLEQVFDLLAPYPGLGRFLAFQYAIDLNYSPLLSFAEADFVVPGPGAIDGISKVYIDTGGLSPTEIIFEMVERQEREFSRLGLQFNGLFGRRLQPIDAQNLFCEISKYARVAHPEIEGISGRTRIKQSYEAGPRPLPQPFFPPSWNLSVPAFDETRNFPGEQTSLF